MTKDRLPRVLWQFRYTHGSGPGGQHVNKVATAVELRINLASLPLNGAAKSRLREQQRGKINKQDELIIHADRHRSQLKNKEDAINRAETFIGEASKQPVKRIATKPTKSSKQRRLKGKKRRGETKSQRRKPEV